MHRDCNWMANYYDSKFEDVDYTRVLLDYEVRVLLDLHISYCLKMNSQIPKRHYEEYEVIFHNFLYFIVISSLIFFLSFIKNY